MPSHGTDKTLELHVQTPGFCRVALFLSMCDAGCEPPQCAASMPTLSIVFGTRPLDLSAITAEEQMVFRTHQITGSISHLVSDEESRNGLVEWFWLRVSSLRSRC